MNKEKYLDGIQSGKRIGVESFMSGFMEHVERCASHHVKRKRSFPIRGHSVNVLGRTFFYFAFLTSRMDSSVSLSENLTFSVIDLFFCLWRPYLYNEGEKTWSWKTLRPFFFINQNLQNVLRSWLKLRLVTVWRLKVDGLCAHIHTVLTDCGCKLLTAGVVPWWWGCRSSRWCVPVCVRRWKIRFPQLRHNIFLPISEANVQPNLLQNYSRH